MFKAPQHANTSAMTALHLAATAGNLVLVTELLQAGHNPNQLNKMRAAPLFCALNLPMSATRADIPEHEAVFKLLWEHTAPEIRTGQDELGSTVLHLMAIHGFDRLADDVLQQAPQLSCMARSYHTQDYPIHSAILNDQCAVAVILLARDAQTWTYLNALGQTPLHVAAQSGSKALLMICCEHHQGDIDQVDREGQTALALLRGRHDLTATQCSDFEQCLLAKGARAEHIQHLGITQPGLY